MANDISEIMLHRGAEPSVADWPRGGSSSRALSVSEQIATQIGEQIVAGSYGPGDRLLEEQISSEFGVSRNPVREALRILERDGFVSISARRGAQVMDLTPEEAIDLFEIEAELYGLMGRRLAQNPDQAALVLLDRTIGRLEACVAENGSCIDYLLLVNRLSLELSSLCGNKSLHQVLSQMLIRNVGYTRSSLKCPTRQARLLDRWKCLRTAVVSGHPGEAERVARDIVTDIGSAVLKIVAEQKSVVA